jgi:hypothetical protein
MTTPTYTGYSNTDWARTAATTLADHIRDEEQAWLKNYQMGALLEANGRVTYNHSGRGMTWDVRYRKHTMEGNSGETPRNFARKNLWKVAALPNKRGYQATDSITKAEMLENRGEPAIIKLFDNFVERISESVKQGIGPEFYQDGSASGNEMSWHGLFTMFNTNGTTTITTGAQRTANAADVVGFPADTYAGITTGPGDYGGEQDANSVWPLGTCDPEFDFWTPLVINPQSTNAAAFPSSTDTWAGAADEILRYAILQSQRNNAQDGGLTNFFLNRESYGPFLNLIDNKEQIRVTRNEAQGLTSLGFRNVVNFDGIEVSWETGIPANVGYGFNYQNIELRCMEDTIFKSEGPFYDEHTQNYNAVVYTLSNHQIQFSPRNVTKWLTLA